MKIRLAQGWRTVAMVCVLALPASACDEVGPRAASSVEAPIFSDAVDYAVMSPGDGQRRAIRVSNFLRGLDLASCGEDGPALSSTAARLMQNVFPDLSLIRSRGLVDADAGVDAGCRSESDLADRVPSHDAVLRISGEWLQFVNEVQRSPALRRVSKVMRQCLIARSGLEVERAAPDAFLDSVNSYMSDRGTRADLMSFSEDYVVCGGRYFGLLADRIQEPRSEFIARHEGVIELFAAELRATGYSAD